MNVVLRLFLGGFLGGGAYWLWRYFAPEHSELMLEKRVAIVTGATTGIGRAMASALAHRGMRVVLVDQRKERLAVVEREITPYADAVMTFQGDIASARQREKLIQRVLKNFGTIDVLVNNASTTAGGLLETHNPERIDEIINLNLTITIQLTRQVLPHMLEQGEGHIVNMGSGLGHLAPPAAAPYVASNFGLAGFSSSLRRELIGTHIKVLHVIRDWTRIEMLAADRSGMIENLFPHYIIEEPEVVADKIVRAMVRGADEIVFGGRLQQAVLWLERTFPGITRFYWQRVFPRWLELVKKAEEYRQPE